MREKKSRAGSEWKTVLKYFSIMSFIETTSSKERPSSLQVTFAPNSQPSSDGNLSSLSTLFESETLLYLLKYLPAPSLLPSLMATG